ncbi:MULTISPECIES: tail fiber domain-containing protein [unclassified Microcoleus]|uniref:tail fiber domain-containing protein n=1 Tax=unclassified Microcoleus TaxID=2642155 RepID=UPI002FD771EE
MPLIKKQRAITAADLPPENAMDVEVSAAINAHAGATDPHPIYLTQLEGDGRYRQSATAITDAELPATIARDTEFQAADTAHVNATDPHTQYRLKSVAITDAELPATIARDAEFQAADTAHVNATDPHSQYLNNTRGDARYLGITAKAADAESVDGIDSSRINFGSNWSKASGAGVNLEANFTTSGFIDCYYGGGTFPPSMSHVHGFQVRHDNITNLWGMQAVCQYNINNEFYFRTINGGVWQPWRRIWNDGNFDPANHAQTFTATTKAVGTSIGGIATANNDPANNCGLEVRSANPASAAYLSLHRLGIYGIHLGLDINNQLSVGGWSLGNVSYKIFHEGSPSQIKAPLPTALVAGNSFVLSWNSVQIGQGTAELCNYSGNGGGDAFNFFRLPGNPNAVPTISNRVARIDVNGSYFQTSDKRVKSDFSQAPGLSVILALFPQKYHHWEYLGIDDKKSLKLGKIFKNKIGFIAQEVQKVLPEAVTATTSEEELYGIDYSCIVACAVQAIQELESQIKELRLQLATINK